MYLGWKPPNRGKFKLNIDGSGYTQHSEACAGDIVRDWKGDWVTGFSAKLGLQSGLAAELTALHLGLKLLVQMHISQVRIEMDAQNIIDLIQEANSDHYLSSNIIQRRYLIRQ